MSQVDPLPATAWHSLTPSEQEQRFKWLVHNAEAGDAASCSVVGWITAQQGSIESSEYWFTQAHSALAKVAADPMTEPNVFGAVRPKTDAELGNARLDIQARDPQLSQEEIVLKARADVESGEWTLRGVVGNPNVPDEVVTDILHRANGNLKILLSAGTNPWISEANAHEIAKWPSAAPSLARNVASPMDLIEEYASAENWVVRKELARNPAAPNRILEALALDSDSRVVDALRANPGVGPLDDSPS